MLHINGLTKRYGKLLANDHLSFDVLPGRITNPARPTAQANPPRSKRSQGFPALKARITIDGHDNKSLEQSARSAISRKRPPSTSS